MASNGDETLNLTVKDQVCSVSGQCSRWMLRAPRAAPSLWQDAMLCLHQGPAPQVCAPAKNVCTSTDFIHLPADWW